MSIAMTEYKENFTLIVINKQYKNKFRHYFAQEELLIKYILL